MEGFVVGIHVDSNLDHDQRIYRQISFYDLVELMTFGRLSFNQSSRRRLASSAVACQSWALLNHDHAIDWSDDDASTPSIHIISTIRALAKSLFICEDLEVFIDRTSRLGLAPARCQSAHSTPVPMFDNSALTVTLCLKNSAVREGQHLMQRLPVDLRTLFADVVVSPNASTRFVELVSYLVQRITHAEVSRASCSIESAAIGSVHARLAGSAID